MAEHGGAAMSTMHDALSEYLTMRRTFGTQLAWPESSLRKFVDFVEAEGAEFLTTELAVRWTFQSAGVQRATHARRLAIVRAFAVWLQATDARTQIPPQGLLRARHYRPVPHIYSEGEITDLMTAASRLRSALGLRGVTFKTLIGLLNATGLRPGEALRLDVSDVDLVAGVLAIRNSKFGKSRFVPLEQSAITALLDYSRFRDAVLPCRDTSAFLVTERHSRLQGYVARRTFASLCQTVGLRPRLYRRSACGPRLQDIRHTFATRRIVQWYRAGLDVDRLIPRLATYLGHTSAASTYWYIQAVPELLHLATERLETAVHGGVR
jgi:site-specific recombinase XerD